MTRISDEIRMSAQARFFASWRGQRVLHGYGAPRPNIAFSSYAKYLQQCHTSCAESSFKQDDKQQEYHKKIPSAIWLGLIGGVVATNVHQDTVYAASPKPLEFSATKQWTYPSIAGGFPHSIIASVKGEAKFNLETGIVECPFTLSVMLNVAGQKPVEVAQSGTVGFVGRDDSGNPLWYTHKGCYSPGRHPEMFSIDSEKLKKTVKIDVLFEMDRPSLSQMYI